MFIMKLPKQSATKVIRTNTTSRAQRTYTPDLRECFDCFALNHGTIFNITSFCQWSKPTILRRTRTKREVARNFADENVENIKVLGVSYSGQDDNVGVVLTGLFTVSNNQKTAINSPCLKFNTETFGFEEELAAIVADIENEVYAFLFKGKRRKLNCSGWRRTRAPGLVAEPEKENGLFPEVGDPANEDDPEDETADM